MKADFQYSNLLDRCLFEQIIPKIMQVRVSLKILHAPSWGCHCLSNHITIWFWPFKSGNSQTKLAGIWVQCIIIRRKRTRLLTTDNPKSYSSKKCTNKYVGTPLVTGWREAKRRHPDFLQASNSSFL
jgi:hypothetical protein